jgi:hypothetical protein
MLLTFCINEFEIQVLGKCEVEKLLHVNAAHVVAIQVHPSTPTPRGSVRPSDATIYTHAHTFRVWLSGRNLTAFSAWQVYVEGQK